MLPAEIDRNDSVMSNNDVIKDKKWGKVFPQSVADETNSGSFMSRAMFVAFSTVIRERRILGDECFKSNYITEKLKIRSLNFDEEKALNVSQLLRSASEAIKEAALEELALVITENENDEEALEVYSWKMTYDVYNIPMAELNVSGGSNSPMHQLAKLRYAGSESVRDQLILLVRSIQMICRKLLEPLIGNICVNFRLSYLPSTRSDYRVDGFNDSVTFYKLSKNCQTATIGHLRPGHHGSLLSCSSIFLSDSYHAETTLKRYADKIADSMGYDRQSTLYQSFLSNESDLGSNNAATSGTTSTPDDQQRNDAIEEADTLAERVEDVRIQSPEKNTGISGRLRGKAKMVEETNKAVSKEKNSTRMKRFGRVSSVQSISPGKKQKLI